MKKRSTIFLSVALMCTGMFSASAQVNPAEPNFGRGRTYVAGYIGNEVVTIDGKADEAFWSLLEFANVDTTVVGVVPTAEDLSAQFKVAWDANNIYIFVDAIDDTIVILDASTNGDNIEFFFNTDSLWYQRAKNNSASDPHRDPYREAKNLTASQIRANVGTLSISGGGFYIYGVSDNYFYDTEITTGGYSLEIQIPFELIVPTSDTVDITFAPEMGRYLAFDVNIGDVDRPIYKEGTTELHNNQRESIITWNAKTTNAWRDVREFGWLVLGEEIISSISKAQSENFRMYPSVASDYVTVELKAIQGAKSIQVVNLLGQKVISFPVANSIERVPVNQLKAGVYMLGVEDSKGTVHTRKFVKK